MKNKFHAETGFALIVSMIILAILSILVVNAVRSTTLSEKMSGSYMDRALAQQAAEQALRQGQRLLLENGEICVAGCSITAGTVAASTAAATTLPGAWSDTGATAITTATNQKTAATFVASLLNDSFLPTSGKTGCKAYSLMGKGVGLDSTRSSVVLQTVVYVCPI